MCHRINWSRLSRFGGPRLSPRVPPLPDGITPLALTRHISALFNRSATCAPPPAGAKTSGLDSRTGLTGRQPPEA